MSYTTILMLLVASGISLYFNFLALSYFLFGAFFFTSVSRYLQQQEDYRLLRKYPVNNYTME